jgi:uncharacterized protein (DUF1778 family)
MQNVPASSIRKRSDAMSAVARARARATARDKKFFRLNADQFTRFTALLDAPASPNPGLERLMAIKPPWCANRA